MISYAYIQSGVEGMDSKTFYEVFIEGMKQNQEQEQDKDSLRIQE